jgi:glutamate racemase
MASDLSNASIGIFDSGFGGLTVMNAIMRALPNENIVYFGDTARLPYGNKSMATVLRYAKENADFLTGLGIKVLVVACNTACAAGLDELQTSCPIPVVGVIPSAIEEMLPHAKEGRVAILGTRSTIQSGVYQRQIKNHLPQAVIHAIPCPLFVPLVEEGYIEHPLTVAAIQEYLTPLKVKEIECLILGCTHYPLIAHMIQRELGQHITMIDPAKGCAEKIRQVLDEKKWHNFQQKRAYYEFYVTDDPEKFRLLGKTFLHYPIEHVHPKLY